MRWRASWPKSRPTFKINNLVASFPLGFPFFVPVAFLDQIDCRVHEMLALGGFRVVLGHFGRRLTEHGGDCRRIASRFRECRAERVSQPVETDSGLHLPLGNKFSDLPKE